jgi:hypothetical protein
VILVLLSSLAQAHGLDAHRVHIELEDAVVRVAATPGVDAFLDADSDRDGLLDRAEVAAARETIRRRFVRAFDLRDPRGDAPTCAPASVSTVGQGAGHVRISLRCVYDHAPERIIVRLAPLGLTPLAVEAVRIRRTAPNRWTPAGAVARGILPHTGGILTLFDVPPSPGAAP